MKIRQQLLPTFVLTLCVAFISACDSDLFKDLTTLDALDNPATTTAESTRQLVPETQTANAVKTEIMSHAQTEVAERTRVVLATLTAAPRQTWTRQLYQTLTAMPANETATYGNSDV